jgi:hypothetical protein
LILLTRFRIILLRYVVNKHIPLKKCKSTQHPAPYMNQELRHAIFKKQMLFNKYNKHNWIVCSFCMFYKGFLKMEYYSWFEPQSNYEHRLNHSWNSLRFAKLCKIIRSNVSKIW